MILSNPFDHADAVRARESQSDPLVQYIVIRRERVASLPALMTAVAQTTVAAAAKFSQPGDPGNTHYAVWKTGSFRKVTLRANERDWPKLLASEPVVVLPGDPIVAVLPPLPRSSAGKFLRGLQAYVVDPSELPADAPVVLAEPAMLIAVNPGPHMGAGKLLAQVAHAALMSTDAPAEMDAGPAWERAVAEWRAVGMPIQVRFPGAVAWTNALAGVDIDAVVVTDSGLTELEPGSKTILASRPARGIELRAWLGALSH